MIGVMKKGRKRERGRIKEKGLERGSKGISPQILNQIVTLYFGYADCLLRWCGGAVGACDS